jgi:hypothetical protein
MHVLTYVRRVVRYIEASRFPDGDGHAYYEYVSSVVVKRETAVGRVTEIAWLACLPGYLSNSHLCKMKRIARHRSSLLWGSNSYCFLSLGTVVIPHTHTFWHQFIVAGGLKLP